jgi:hypothetical protein
MRNRKFNQQSYDECDGISKTTAIAMFKPLGMTAFKPDQEHYSDFDLVFNDGLRVEVEASRKWKRIDEHNPAWQFKHVNIPYRKRTNKCDVYIVFSYNYDYCMLFQLSDVLLANDIHHVNGEPFFKLQNSKTTVIKVSDTKGLLNYLLAHNLH